MARDGTGLYSLPAGYPFVYGTLIDQATVNSILADMGNELTNSLDKGGRTTPTANLPMGGFKLTGLAAGAAAGDSIRYEQALNADTTTLASAATTNIAGQLQSNITVTGSVAITSFGTGAAAGVRKFLTFTGSPLITHSATLICPGASNFTVTAGGTMELISEGSNVWRVCNPQTGQQTKLSELGNAAAAHSLTAGNYTQTWAWTFTTYSQLGMILEGEGGTWPYGTLLTLRQKATGTSVENLLDVIGSPAGGGGLPMSLLKVTHSSVYLNGWNAYSGNEAGTVQIRSGNGGNYSGGHIIIAAGYSTYASYGSGYSGGNVEIEAGDGPGASGVGGYFRISGGDGTYQGGDVIIRPGTGSTIPGILTLQNGDGTIALKVGKKVPTISSGGGAGATIRGCDNFFEVTFGTGSPSNVVVGFNTAKTAAPMVVVSGTQVGQVLTYSATTAGITIASGTAFTAGTKVSCFVVDAY